MTVIVCTIKKSVHLENVHEISPKKCQNVSTNIHLKCPQEFTKTVSKHVHKIHPKCPREFTPKMSMKIHLRGQILADKNFHENAWKVTTRTHQNSPFLSTIILPSFIYRVFPAWVSIFPCFQLQDFPGLVTNLSQNPPARKRRWTLYSHRMWAEFWPEKQLTNNAYIVIMPVKPLLSLYSQRMLLKQYLIPKKKAKFNPKLIFKWKDKKMHWW